MAALPINEQGATTTLVRHTATRSTSSTITSGRRSMPQSMGCLLQLRFLLSALLPVV